MSKDSELELTTSESHDETPPVAAKKKAVVKKRGRPRKDPSIKRAIKRTKHRMNNRREQVVEQMRDEIIKEENELQEQDKIDSELKLTTEQVNKLIIEGIEMPGGLKFYGVLLQGRHSDFLERTARMEGRNNGQMLERFVRIGYQNDPYKAGLIDPETETGFSGRSADMKIP